MRFLVYALHAGCMENTSHDVAMSRYSAVRVTFGQVLGANHFIKALEPCIVCKLPPFQHSRSWVTVGGWRRLQRPRGFTQLRCCRASV